MTDEILITKYLEDNFRVIISNGDFVVLDLYNQNKLISYDFIKLFNLIFGEFMTTENDKSIDIFYKWFGIKKRKLTKKLDAFIETLDGNKGSLFLLNLMIEEFKNDIYDLKFINRHLNAWYSENFMDKIIEDLIPQLVITLGRTNWIVTWIGHGPLSDKKVISRLLGKENDDQKKYFAIKYNAWYSEAIIEACERQLKFF